MLVSEKTMLSQSSCLLGPEAAQMLGYPSKALAPGGQGSGLLRRQSHRGDNPDAACFGKQEPRILP